MLHYVLRVRDLVHGTILFTEQEQRIINHPLFQRLRQVRQNDVAFYVYPSLNTSRFEHVLGTCRVAGMMAESLTQCPQWRAYFRELKAQTGIASKEEFVELTRLYALLHDIGHLPLSHLFEFAMEEWVGRSNVSRDRGMDRGDWLQKAPRSIRHGYRETNGARSQALPTRAKCARQVNDRKGRAAREPALRR